MPKELFADPRRHHFQTSLSTYQYGSLRFQKARGPEHETGTFTDLVSVGYPRPPTTDLVEAEPNILLGNQGRWMKVTMLLDELAMNAGVREMPRRLESKRRSLEDLGACLRDCLIDG